MPRIKTLCDEEGIEFRYETAPHGTNVVFMRKDPFAGNEPASNRPNPLQSAAIRRNPPEKSELIEALSRVGGNDKRVYEFIVENGPSKSTSISESLGIPVRTVRDILKRLIEANLISSKGQGKNTEYSLKR